MKNFINPRPPYPNELFHHGIKGQQWGVRNGPPYPLGSGKVTTHRDRVIRTKEDEKIISEIQKWDNNKRKDTIKSLITEKQYKSAAKLALSNTRNSILKLRRRTESIDPNTGLYLKNRKSSILQDAINVNPSHTDTTTSSENNCLLCTVAYDIRRRGYDVVSKQHAKIDLLYDVGVDDVKDWYPGAKYKKFNNGKESLNTALKFIEKNEKNGTRGYLDMAWGENSGHVVSYEKLNGKLYFIDSQSANVYEYKKGLPKIYNGAISAGYMRLDNIQPNYILIKEAIE
jgi:hypothetical protein